MHRDTIYIEDVQRHIVFEIGQKLAEQDLAKKIKIENCFESSAFVAGISQNYIREEADIMHR